MSALHALELAMDVSFRLAYSTTITGSRLHHHLKDETQLLKGELNSLHNPPSLRPSRYASIAARAIAAGSFTI